MVIVVALCIDVANAGPYESIFDTADSWQSCIWSFLMFFCVCVRQMGIDLHMCCAIAVGGNDAVCTRSTVQFLASLLMACFWSHNVSTLIDSHFWLVFYVSRFGWWSEPVFVVDFLSPSFVYSSNTRSLFHYLDISAYGCSSTFLFCFVCFS
jgi:hypothetical protein